MWHVRLAVERKFVDEREVSDILSLTPAAATTLAALPTDVRSIVEDEIAQVFRAVVELAYIRGKGLREDLIQLRLPQTLKSLVTSGFAGDDLWVTYPVARFSLAKELADPRIWITRIVLNQKQMQPTRRKCTRDSGPLGIVRVRFVDSRTPRR
jgi:hypothetical protein